MAGAESEKGYKNALDLESLKSLAVTRLSALLPSPEGRVAIPSSLDLAEFIKLLPLKLRGLATAAPSPDHVGNLDQGGLETRPDLFRFIELARREGLIRDFVGIGRKTTTRTIVFSSIVGEQPKPYLAMYLLFINRLKQDVPGLRFVVHLEDWFAPTLLSQPLDLNSKDKYIEYIQRFEVVDTIITTSSLSTKAIPQRFTEQNLSGITLGDFISVLPFAKHSLDNIHLCDLLHFAWNVYLISTMPGVYLTNINSKKEFLVFRKALHNNPPVIFFPDAPESMTEPTAADFYERYLAFSKRSINRQKLEP